MPEDERDDIKNDRSGDQPDKGSRLPEGRPRLSMWIYLAIFVALLVQIFLFMRGVETNTIEYSTFLDYVEEGKVAELKIVNDRRIEGEYTAKAVEEGSVEMAEEKTDFLGNTSETNLFVTTKTANHDLIEFLSTYNKSAVEAGEVPVKYDVAYDDNWFGGVLTWILPLAIIIALWVFLIRRMNPGSQVLNIGKNKAVLFDAMGDHLVTFKDVAGLDEAKEEVAEVVEFLQNPQKFTKLGGLSCARTPPEPLLRWAKRQPAQYAR